MIMRDGNCDQCKPELETLNICLGIRTSSVHHARNIHTTPAQQFGWSCTVLYTHPRQYSCRHQRNAIIPPVDHARKKRVEHGWSTKLREGDRI